MKIAVSLSVSVLALAILGGCAKNKVASPSTELSCREDLARARKQFDKKRWVEAQTKLQEITKNCTGYDFTQEAQYLLAESHFRAEEWYEAESEFRLLLSTFERSPWAEEANWKIALASGRQSLRWDLDQTQTLSAIDLFETFLAEYPGSTRVDSAKSQVDELRDRLARKRYETARLYLRMREPQAATIYANALLEEFPDSRRIPEARLLLSRAYAKLDQFDRARENLAAIDSLGVPSELAGKRKSAGAYVDRLEKKFRARRERESEELREANR